MAYAPSPTRPPRQRGDAKNPLELSSGFWPRLITVSTPLHSPESFEFYRNCSHQRQHFKLNISLQKSKLFDFSTSLPSNPLMGVSTLRIQVLINARMPRIENAFTGVGYPRAVKASCGVIYIFGVVILFGTRSKSNIIHDFLKEIVRSMTAPYAAIVSLGCAKNQVDSHIMATQLLEMGYALTDDPQTASLILINTCGFLESSVEESVDAIIELAHWKKTGTCSCLVVAGCMVQRYGRKLLRSLPEVDVFLGISHAANLKSILNHHRTNAPNPALWLGRPTQLLEELGSSPVSPNTSASAYVRIADGCNNRCTFCMIPHIRGPFRSRPVRSILEETRALAGVGTVEINLIAQDITSFGSDRDEKSSLIDLLQALEFVDGIRWIRLLYAYPHGVSDDLLRVMRASAKIVPYLDIPLQHCVPEILQAMRGTLPSISVDHFVDRIRSIIPEVALRTTLMVGFPGETEKHFDELLSFVERTRFDHLGVFAFSPEPGTRAARLPGQLRAGEKERRLNELLALQKDISQDLLARRVGQLLPVLVEGIHPETDLLLAGRLKNQAPEVDGTVWITRGMATAGEIVDARITKCHAYDLEAEIAPADCAPTISPTEADSHSKTF
jgi:ribosomal protein S12 methylthiotransferase